MSITLDNNITRLYFGDNYLDGTFTGSNFITQAYFGNSKILDFTTFDIIDRYHNSSYISGDMTLSTGYVNLPVNGKMRFTRPVSSFTMKNVVASGNSVTLKIKAMINDTEYKFAPSNSTYELNIVGGSQVDVYNFDTPGGSSSITSDAFDITPYNFTLGSGRKLTVQYGKDLFYNLSSGYDKNNFYGYTFEIENTGSSLATFSLTNIIIQT